MQGAEVAEGYRHQRPDFGQDANPLAVAMAEQERQTLAMVQQALKSGRMRLAYQPVVLGSDPTRIAFHEALIRILDETGRIIPARDFMPVAETRELGREIDCAALDMGLKALARHAGLRLSVNMSARSIGYPRWMRVLRHGLALGPTVGERLILEITENSAMLVPEIVIAFMDDLQAKGVAFALDDFGAGYTAFRYLKEFFFDIVKIDGQFIRGIHTDPDNQVLTRALVSIGQQFEMLTIAESVECVEDAQFLQQIGVNCLQGYLFGAPTLKPDFLQETRRKRA
ncbi:MAG: diguanylate phosphodiesterase [Rhodobacteraceae bacterium GWE1_64_9]|nr:MAG: diguanylate phosphodiesterase [Rhodobacteraceae bacterium GWE1_64_9]OHC50026.1 MAG: diguanylate phosphodiesterase [Rhodobacteraceae bacterium GWF1_65_7]